MLNEEVGDVVAVLRVNFCVRLELLGVLADLVTVVEVLVVTVLC